MNMRVKFLPFLLAGLLLAACSGSGVSGTYVGGFGSLTFDSGKVDANLMGATVEMNYTTDGNKVILHAPQGNLVLTRNKDGSLQTPWGTMRKRN